MKTNEDFEFYLSKMGLAFEMLKEGMWVLREPEQVDHLLIVHSPPVVVFRLKLMEWSDVEPSRQQEFFRRLLELNTRVVHGAFALEGNNVVVLDSLQAENLDYNEFQASIDSLVMAVTDFYPELSSFRVMPSRKQEAVPQASLSS